PAHCVPTSARIRFPSTAQPSRSHFPLSFHVSRHLRHLHSFPTRRSSDLGAFHPLHRVKWVLHPAVDHARVVVEHRCLRSEGNDRSEEHTSELQSRFDLVCRLLLEKKKNLHHEPGRRAV